MHYTWHYNIIGSNLYKLHTELLEYHNLSIEPFYRPGSDDLVAVVVDVEETHIHFQDIIALLGGSENTGYTTVMHFPKYTEAEMLSAQWLSVRSSYSKVIPENEFEITNYYCSNGTDSAGNIHWQHKDESGMYVVKKGVKWGRQHFASSITGEQYLFCSDSARSILLENGIGAIEFCPVLHKSSQAPVDNLYQMISTYTIPDGAIVGVQYSQEVICSQCGMHMIQSKDDRCRYAIRNGMIPENIDYCTTLPLFLGQQEGSPCDAFRRVLISQKLYRVLKRKKIDRALWFEPIDVV